MAGPIPFEHWRSRTEAALEFRKTMSPREIAERMGLSVNAVSGLLASAAQKGHRQRVAYGRTTPAALPPRPVPEAGHAVQIILPPHQFAALIAEARRQNLTPAQLARKAVTALIQKEAK